MKRTMLGMIALSVGLTSLLPSCSDRLGSFDRVAPEDAGFSSKKLRDLERHLEQSGSAAFLALHDGKVVFSWGNVFEKYPVHSIRKALMNALYGIHHDRGSIDTNMTLAALGINDVPPELTDDEKRARVADLLRSRSGVYHVAAAEAAKMIDTRPDRGSHEPGEFFYCNNWDFNALGTILEQETGSNVFEAFERDIAAPLGMTGFTSDDGFFLHGNDRSEHPAYHFRMSAHDLALFGLLYQRDGDWNGERILQEEWIRESTRKHSTAIEKWGIGYGLLWYTFPEDFEGTYFHSGAGAHILAVYPALDLVIVHRVDTERVCGFTTEDLIEVIDKFFVARTDG